MPDHPPAVQLIVELSREADIDEAELDEMTRNLRLEMEELPYVQSAGPPRVPTSGGAAPPKGTKAAELQTLGRLAMNLLPVAIPAVIGFLKDWSLRPGNRSIKLRVQRGERSTEVEYDPRAMSLDEVKSLAAELQAMLDR